MADFIPYNPNPNGLIVGDCVVRAISAVTGQDWDTTYTGLVFQGFALKDMPSGNYVWGEYLRSKGFVRHQISNVCPMCYTVGQFADEHPIGSFVVGTGDHAIAIINGTVYDTADSRNAVVMYYYRKENI